MFEQWARIEAKQAIQRPPADRRAIWFESGRTPAFAYRCKGNSMIPTFYDGELVYIDPCQRFRDGQVAALEIAGRLTLKRLFRVPDGLRLVPDNQEYLPVTVAADDAKIIGIAVARGCQKLHNS